MTIAHFDGSPYISVLYTASIYKCYVELFAHASKDAIMSANAWSILFIISLSMTVLVELGLDIH